MTRACRDCKFCILSPIHLPPSGKCTHPEWTTTHNPNRYPYQDHNYVSLSGGCEKWEPWQTQLEVVDKTGVLTKWTPPPTSYEIEKEPV